MAKRDTNNHATGQAETARLLWDEQGQPLAQAFEDFYFSRASGLEESRYVFVQHNDLPQRFEQLPADAAFTVAETGFGTGLTFLSCWHCWRQQAPATARLHFISVERHPLNPDDLTRALALWPQLDSLAQALIKQYPPACNGYHRLSFDQGRVQLTLLYGEASDAFSRLDAEVDAWFLDGFSPAKNPEMWSDALFAQLARLSRTGTSFSTFTAASDVRRGLEQVGFRIEKAKGFGLKREMIRGRYEVPVNNSSEPDQAPVPGPNTARSRPWFDRPQPCADNPQRVLVIGAGIAGASTAFALAERGCRVSLYERGAAPGCGASGNPQGVLYAKLPAQPTYHSRIHLSGYLHSLRLLHRLAQPGEDWAPCGVIQLALNDKEQTKQQALLQGANYPKTLVTGLNQAQASEQAGLPLAAGGLLFPEAGWVSPARLCARLLQHPNIDCHFNQPIEQIRFEQQSRSWQLFQNGQLLDQSQQLVVCTAHEANQLEPLTELPLKPIRGQTTSLPQIEASASLKSVVCANGYISPPKNGRYCFGASFDLHDQSPELRSQDHRLNLAHVEEISPLLGQQLGHQLEQALGRVGFRCAAPDYLPIVGAVPDRAAYLHNYRQLSRDAKAEIDTPPVHLPGLFVNLAHGSKGMITAPLAGSLLADLILNQPLGLERELLETLNPARFLIKKVIKGAI
ncbi:bifunctional tRNA (5-methylaminomethyl-2-thiouridine)(34)-methyltransferase MnmD/FAD-dependent 5-carboxymethylaminomethyl-2-thiouridine(34) oxidoreductase MnmC [Motiliproteus coralliicola]|uniref:tRNA 5-methylaminomethyl-2-thiouridine biosynthesis bifunctional protein MnmC n=1 Tax=Motiliproteus coralliicola TaxID=2283196 RepID=A0A369WLW2_9GAMM|nr:bifunctional tRNA (5-methylaminomethyl-2-thiouridine)(34)-methyltransferase MnmD/FAD-dependent 5-carboxymethylaminomethyl-2-thiouridine(34) oxidoreductase MnmC [Motiliproteus coralliicola]RDE22451.1 bifunctional tRNA (5-methylaminomethyl-2-thiouridine)(34)-methyltransferase MnmD/FAD-dependent 5-carboxymethylaminomethyl-2-thiouridine(34) oxidoreductase MnmC [Motiliproteus coralliicola]